MARHCRSATSRAWVHTRTAGKKEEAEDKRGHPTVVVTLGRSPLLQPGAGLADLLLDLGAIDVTAIASQRFLPRGCRVGIALLLESQIAQVLLNDRTFRQLGGRFGQRG